MKITRGKTFEGSKGVWEKVEVELDSTDLLPDELSSPLHVRPQLLEIRAEKHLILFLRRTRQMSPEEAQQAVTELDSYRSQLLSIKPRAQLRDRGPNEQ